MQDPPATYDQISPAVDVLEGWMTYAQGQRLFTAARRCPAGGQIVEIGSFRGKSTVVLASAAGSGVEVVAIDPHGGNDRGPQEFDGYEAEAADDHLAFMRNLASAGVGDRVRHVREYSNAAHDAVDGRIDLLYVDGAHRFSPALKDIRSWGRRVDAGGTMLIHDAFSSLGVTCAIAVELLFGRRFRYCGRSGSLVEYRADLPSGPRARSTNIGRQALQFPWFVRNLVVKSAILLGVGRLLRRCGRSEPSWPY